MSVRELKGERFVFVTSEDKLKRCFTIFVVGFFCAVVFHYVRGVYDNSGSPLNTFLFFPTDHFGDLEGLRHFNQNLNPYHEVFRTFTATYPPGVYIAILPFTQLPIDVGNVLYIVLFVFMICYFNRHYLKKIPFPLSPQFAIFALSLMSYQTLFNIDRLNAEILVFIFASLFVLLSEERREKWGAVFLGFAAGMKIYPLLFIAVTPWKKILPVALIACLSAVALNALSLIVFATSPFDVLSTYKDGFDVYHNFVFVNTSGIQFGVSLFGLLKSIAGKLNPQNLTDLVSGQIAQIAFFLNVGISLISIWLFLKRPLLLWEKFFLCCVAILLGPPTSFDYKLIYLYFPLLTFLLAPPSPEDRIFSILLPLLFVPKSYSRLFECVTLSVILNPLLILAIWFFICRRAFRRPPLPLGILS